MKWFVAALLGLVIVLPTLVTDSFAQGKSGSSHSGQTGTAGNQGNGPNAATSGNAGGTHK
jgi:hypothetical protein